MRGLPLFNFQAFEEGAHALRACGLNVTSPHDVDIEERLVDVEFFRNALGLRTFVRVELTPRFSIERALRRDFEEICRSQAIALLPGAEHSEGTQREIQVAKWIGLPIPDHDSMVRGVGCRT